VFLLKDSQSFPQRRTADAQVIGKLGFVNAFPRSKFAPNDFPSEVSNEAFRQSWDFHHNVWPIVDNQLPPN
jgi:hypothetical protein